MQGVVGEEETPLIRLSGATYLAVMNIIFYEIGIVWPICHYFTNFIEANRIKIIIINSDIPLLTDGRQFSVRMTVKLPAVEM